MGQFFGQCFRLGSFGILFGTAFFVVGIRPVAVMVEPEFLLKFTHELTFGTERLVGIAHAVGGFAERGFCHRHPVEDGGSAAVGNVGFAVKGGIKEQSGGITDVQGTGKWQYESTAGGDAPGGKRLSESHAGRVETEPVFGRIEKSGQSQRGIGQEPDCFIPGTAPLGL